MTVRKIHFLQLKNKTCLHRIIKKKKKKTLSKTFSKNKTFLNNLLKKKIEESIKVYGNQYFDIIFVILFI